MNEITQLLLEKQWLYPFKLEGGMTAPCPLDETVTQFNQARLAHLDAAISNQFQENWEQTRVIDLSCKQGYFGLHLAQLGAQVTGIDANRTYVNDANLLAQGLKLSHRFKAKKATIEDVMPEKYGRYDIVLMLGLIYHLENPVAAIRSAYAVCKGLCVIETHLLTGQEQSEDSHVSVVKRMEEVAGYEEIQSNGLCLVPNQAALIDIMETVGFKQVSVVLANDNQNIIKKRCWVVGHK